mmetsp:Transcript_4991/g.15224  ORF Transcript_4991/g.15224 Transcript_4991/m.15224 type:complete len:172 (+) Transcript_4991:3-518(+)
MGGVGSIMDAAAGLLVDPALAERAVAAVQAEDESLAACPDLAFAASARAVAAVLAAAEPTAQMLPVVGSEPRGMEGAGGLLAGLGLAPRAWDERGLEVLSSEDGGLPVAVGLTSAGGLLGAAVQWRPSGAVRSAVTAVVLTNELSVAAVPAQMLAEVALSLGLPVLASFSP